METDSQNHYHEKHASDMPNPKDDSRKKLTYKKRSGTSGVTGQLYETKLLSLVLFRALNDEDIKEFYLGNNLDDIGAFDDICFKFRLDKVNVAAFIQAKHRDDPRKGGFTDSDLGNKKGDFSLRTYFDSYLKIKEKFENSKSLHEKKIDIMFTESFENTESYFIIYTPAAGKITKKANIRPNKYICKISNLISTRDTKDIFQVTFDESDINSLSDCLIEEQLHMIAKALFDCVVTNSNIVEISKQTIEIIRKYQEFLIPHVIEFIQEATEDSKCNAKINPKLLFSNSSNCIKLRDMLFEKILSVTSFDEKEFEYELKYLLSPESNLNCLSKVIGKIVVFNKKTNTLDLAATAPEKFLQYKNKLNKFLVTHANVTQAYYVAGKEKLLSIRFKLPRSFFAFLSTDKATKTEYEIDNNIKILDNFECDAHIFDKQVNIAKQFLNRLYFYTKEAKQDEVEAILKKELHKSNINIFDKNNLSNMRSEAIFLKFHDKIQKWSMLQGNVYYLTNSCDYLEKSRREIIGLPNLTTLNINYSNKLQKYTVKFKDEIVNKLQLNNLPTGITTIVTNAKILTSIKLMQLLSNVECAFIDTQCISNFTSTEIQTLLEEIKSVEMDVLVIICGKENDEFEVVTRILERFTNKVIVVTNHTLTSIKNTQLDNNIFVDVDNNLIDLTEETQKEILDCNEMIIQGVKVPLCNVIENESKYLITSEPLLKLLNNECIVVGKNLIDEKYENIKDYYIPRTLTKNRKLSYRTDSKKEYKIDNFYDISDSVVVLTAEPGMGKSTLITHLSVETKLNYPNIWIVRINLLDHCSEFLHWQEENKNISLKDAMTLVCKSEIDNVNENFDLAVTDGKIVLTNCNINSTALLILEFVIQSYNNGTIIFLFDGFDEICPHYEKEVINFIKTFIPENENTQKHKSSTSIDQDFEEYGIDNHWNYSDSEEDSYYERDNFVSQIDQVKEENKNNIRKFWITSRPYNTIKHILESTFGPSHQLIALGANDQRTFYQKYLEANIRLDILNIEQFRNIEEFFEYMLQFRRDFGDYFNVLHITSIPLHRLFEIAVDHFRNAILQTTLKIDKEKLRNEWISEKELLSVLERCLGNLTELGRAMQLAGIPLHMHIAANYFVNEIKNTATKNAVEKWDLNGNTFAYYESFLATKLKTIRFEEKNRRYTSCPDERLAYEKEKKDFTENHKKLAFFAMFNKYNTFRKLISKRAYSKIKGVIKKIEKGEEKSGLIHRIHKNIPRFIHLVFAEYFAFEYIADSIKNSKNDAKSKYINFLINELLLDGSIGIMTVFDHKLMHDEKLKNALSDIESKRYVFELLMAQNEMKEEHFDGDTFYEEKIEPSILKAVGNGLFNIVLFLLSSLEGNLNEANLETFIELIGEYFFASAALLKRNDVIIYVLDRIRTIDAVVVRSVLIRSELRYYFRGISDCILPSNEEILKYIHAHAQQMVTPHWYYDEYEREYRQVYMDGPNNRIKNLAKLRDVVKSTIMEALITRIQE